MFILLETFIRHTICQHRAKILKILNFKGFWAKLAELCSLYVFLSL